MKQAFLGSDAVATLLQGRHKNQFMQEVGGQFHSGAQFRTTHWSVVLAAGGAAEEKGRALEVLCRTYWYPLYAFLRRRGHAAHEAQDLTQEFFSRLLDSESLQNVHPEKGRFRTFLLAALKNFLANQWRDSQRLKRGGGLSILSWDEINPEERYQLEPDSGDSPEQAFDRHWAQTVVANALKRLGEDMRREGNAARFEALKPYLQAASQQASYVETAARLGMTESAVKSSIHRLRRQFADIVRQEVAGTVDSESDVEEEIRRLIAILAGQGG